MINLNYGVCIPSEGKRAAVTTLIVAPFSDSITTQMAVERDGAEAAQLEAEAIIVEQDAA